MCLAADVPLIESGTSGYSGQVELIKKGKFKQCFNEGNTLLLFYLPVLPALGSSNHIWGIFLKPDLTNTMLQLTFIKVTKMFI